MSDRECEMLEESLIALPGSPDSLDPHARSHLASCPDCRAFAKLLAASRAEEGKDTLPDYRAVDSAFARADGAMHRRKGAFEFLAFLALASALVLGIVLAAANGHVKEMLVALALAYSLVPFIGFAVIIRTLKGANVCQL